MTLTESDVRAITEIKNGVARTKATLVRALGIKDGDKWKLEHLASQAALRLANQRHLLEAIYDSPQATSDIKAAIAAHLGREP